MVRLFVHDSMSSKLYVLREHVKIILHIPEYVSAFAKASCYLPGAESLVRASIRITYIPWIYLIGMIIEDDEYKGIQREDMYGHRNWKVAHFFHAWNCIRVLSAYAELSENDVHNMSRSRSTFLFMRLSRMPCLLLTTKICCSICVGFCGMYLLHVLNHAWIIAWPYWLSFLASKLVFGG